MFDRGATIIEGATIFKGGASMMNTPAKFGEGASPKWGVFFGEAARYRGRPAKSGGGRLVGPILFLS